MQYQKFLSPLIAMTFITAPVRFAFAVEEQPGVESAVPADEEAPSPETPDSPSPETLSEETPDSPVESGEASEVEDTVSEGEESTQDVAEEPQTEEELEPQVEGPERPLEPQIGGKPAKGKGMMIAGGTLLGLGAAGLATSIVFTQCKELTSSFGCENREQRRFVVPISASVVTLGALLLTFGVVNHVKYRRWEKWTPGKEAALAPVLYTDGAGISYAARF